MEFNETVILFKGIEYENILFINGEPILLESTTVQGGVKKLKVAWTPELTTDIEHFHNIDAERELTALLSEQIAAEVDREILDTLRYNQEWMDNDIFIPTRSDDIPQVSNVNERRVFNIPIDTISDEEIEDYIRAIANKFNNNPSSLF